MAEIPIERKQSRSWVPLALLGLLLLLILGYCFLRPRDVTPVGAGADSARTATVGADTARGAMGAAGATTGAAAGAMGAAATGGAGSGAGSAVDQFIQFAQARDTTKETEGQHAYTAEGIRRIAAALDQVAGQSGSSAIQVYADSMRRSVDRLQQSSPKDVHAEDAKAAFSAAVSAMTTIDKAQGRTYDVAPMRAIYNQLSPSKPLMPQLSTVQRFFTAAGQALQAMNVPGANASGSAAGNGMSGAGANGTGTSGSGQ